MASQSRAAAACSRARRTGGREIWSSVHGKLPGVAVPNLTRTDAAARAELLTVQSYDLQLDVTDGAGHPGAETFRSTTTVEFSCREPGAATFIDLIAETVHSATLNGAELDVSTYTEDGGLPLPGLAEQNTLVVTADCRYSNTGEGLHRFAGPRGRAGLPLHAVRAGRRQADVRLLRPARPQGHVHAARGRALRLAGRLQHRRPHHRGGPGRLPARALRADQADLDLPRRAHRRPLRPGHRLARGHPAGPLLPGVAGPVPRPRRAVRRHQAGLRLLPPGLRLPVPVRQVRPALRARVQRRGHGERRRGDLPRGLRLPLEGQPGHATSGARRRSCTSWRTCGSATW